jgi:hypothetical protein
MRKRKQFSPAEEAEERKRIIISQAMKKRFIGNKALIRRGFLFKILKKNEKVTDSGRRFYGKIVSLSMDLDRG